METSKICVKCSRARISSPPNNVELCYSLKVRDGFIFSFCEEIINTALKQGTELGGEQKLKGKGESRRRGEATTHHHVCVEKGDDWWN